eukprot:427380-Rhodomonas_salina.1
MPASLRASGANCASEPPLRSATTPRSARTQGPSLSPSRLGLDSDDVPSQVQGASARHHDGRRDRDAQSPSESELEQASGWNSASSTRFHDDDDEPGSARAALSRARLGDGGSGSEPRESAWHKSLSAPHTPAPTPVPRSSAPLPLRVESPPGRGVGGATVAERMRGPGMWAASLAVERSASRSPVALRSAEQSPGREGRVAAGFERSFSGGREEEGGRA